ncbi:variable surface protein [Plasmodium gonderi]|uniref:Variable surface protein n=1 Tax=Plasmodium gonderi TaxID=77519 RepID=A0A1Y1JQ60_PLAGO|nr:variable surface protein [Plasmodium gonderi]GAW84559.1 variable surface protein [Plasmodium gonderi]
MFDDKIKIKDVCKIIRNHLICGSRDRYSIEDCKKLIRYLKHIYGIMDAINKPKYFYDKIAIEGKNNGIMDFVNTCKNEIKNLDDELYTVLKDLNGLYQLLEGEKRCSPNGACNSMYKELPIKYEGVDKQSVHTFLEEFKNENMKYIIEEHQKQHAFLFNPRFTVLI